MMPRRKLSLEIFIILISLIIIQLDKKLCMNQSQKKLDISYSTRNIVWERVAEDAFFEIHHINLYIGSK